MKKKLLLLLVILLLTGCGAITALKDNYNQMQIGKDGINGYIMDLRVYSNNVKDNINDIIKITNYNDTQYEIIKVYTASTKNLANEEAITISNKIIYINDEKVYTAINNGVFKIEKKNITYNNPNIYLESLNHITKIDKGTITTIGEDKYTLYKVKFAKSIVKTIIADTALNKLKIKDDVAGEVYIDSNDYVYRIVFKMTDATIKVSYFNFDKVRPINFPKGIK